MSRKHATVLAVLLGGYGLWRGQTWLTVAAFVLLVWGNWRAASRPTLGTVDKEPVAPDYNPSGSFRGDAMGTPGIAVAAWPGAGKCC